MDDNHVEEENEYNLYGMNYDYNNDHQVKSNELVVSNRPSNTEQLLCFSAFAKILSSNLWLVFIQILATDIEDEFEVVDEGEVATTTLAA